MQGRSKARPKEVMMKYQRGCSKEASRMVIYILEGIIDSLGNCIIWIVGADLNDLFIYQLGFFHS